LLIISVDVYSGRPGYFLRVENVAIPAEGTSVADLTSVIHAAVFEISYVVVVPHIDMVAVHLLGSMTSSTGFVAAIDPNTMLCRVSLFVNQRVATISLVVLQQIGYPVFPGDELIGDVPDIVVPPIVNPVIPPAVDVIIPPIVNPVVPPNPLADLNALPLAVVQNRADLVTEALAFISAGGVMTPSEFQD
jgi:hypothetical protein